MKGGHIRKYLPREVEAKWQKRWEESGLYRTVEDPTRPKHYALTMLPYTSGDLHIGHWYAMSPSDAKARFMRMNGYNVFFPVGFDAFGLPAENAAIQHGIHPSKWTLGNVERMRGQLRSMGAMWAWDREAVSCLPGYYKWTEWFFLKFYDMGLAAVGQTVLVELQEEPLRPLVVVGQAGDDLAAPVVDGAHALQLAAHVLHVLHRPDEGVNAALDGGVLGGQTEGVEAHGVKHVVALHPLETGADVGGRHGVPVADVQVARGVGEHGQGVPLGAGRVLTDLVELILRPLLLPLLFDFFGFIVSRHFTGANCNKIRAGAQWWGERGKITSAGYLLPITTTSGKP